MAEKFKFPEVTFFTQVLWAPQNPRTEPTPGVVVAPHGTAVDILTAERGRIELHTDCLHADDPRLEHSPSEQFRRDRGVFVLAPEQPAMADLRRRIEDLEARAAANSPIAKRKPEGANF